MSNGTALPKTHESREEAESPAAFEIIRPARQTTPLVLASPHSGDHYPADFLKMSKLDRATLRLSEDCYVDELIASGPGFGVPADALAHVGEVKGVRRALQQAHAQLLLQRSDAPAQARLRHARAALGRREPAGVGHAQEADQVVEPVHPSQAPLAGVGGARQPKNMG